MNLKEYNEELKTRSNDRVKHFLHQLIRHLPDDFVEQNIDQGSIWIGVHDDEMVLKYWELEGIHGHEYLCVADLRNEMMDVVDTDDPIILNGMRNICTEVLQKIERMSE